MDKFSFAYTVVVNYCICDERPLLQWDPSSERWDNYLQQGHESRWEDVKRISGDRRHV